ncbi:hypothetical protein [Nocardia thraciensis]
MTEEEPPGIVEIALFRDVDPDEFGWSAEWGMLDGKLRCERTAEDLGGLVEHVLTDARRRWGHDPAVAVQWALHRGDPFRGSDYDLGADVTGTVVDGVPLPATLPSPVWNAEAPQGIR